MAAELRVALTAQPLPTQLRRITTTVAGRGGAVMHHHFTFRPSSDRDLRGAADPRPAPVIAHRMQLERLRHFDLTRLPSIDEEVYLFRCVAPKNPSDERLVAMAQVRDLTPLRDSDGRLVALPAAEDTLAACLDAIRKVQSGRPRTNGSTPTGSSSTSGRPPNSPATNSTCSPSGCCPPPQGAGLEEVMFLARRRDPETRELTDIAVRISYDVDPGVRVEVGPRPTGLIEPLDDYRQKVLRAARRGTVYPYELTAMLAGATGGFTEYDLDGDGEARAGRPAARPQHRRHRRGRGQHADRALPRGRRPGWCCSVTRPSRSAHCPNRSVRGSSPHWTSPSSAACRWSGSRCPRARGSRWSPAPRTWTGWPPRSSASSSSPRRAARSTSWSPGINVGAQPYWNAEATMLMHTKGILVMTPDSAMVLTGKQALDFSGSVSAEDNFGIGGYDRVMGPNGQAQYWAPNIGAARDVLMAHYEHTYVAPGESGPRAPAPTDPHDRDISGYPHTLAGSDFTHRRRDLLLDRQPGPQEGLRHPHRHARRVRPGPRRAGTLGRHGRRGHRGRAGRAPRRSAGVPARHRVAVGAAPRLPAHRRPGHLHRRHAVPALVQEGGQGDQRGQRQPAAGGAGQPLRLRRFPGVHAQTPTGVRRRDRQGHRELPRPHRVLRDLPLSRRRVRGVLQGAQPEHDRARGRRLVRLGDRRRARRGRGVHRRSQPAHRDRQQGRRGGNPARRRLRRGTRPS